MIIRSSSFAIASYSDTWGHYAPMRNKTYKCKARLMVASHGEYGRGLLVLDYTDWDGPFFHDALIRSASDVCTNPRYSTIGSVDLPEKMRAGIWDVPVTFRNYRLWFCFSRAIRVCGDLRQ